MILGIDIGGSKVALALGDGEGRILGETRLGPPDPSPARALADILIEARGLLSGAGVAAPDAIGVSAPGPLDRRAGTLCGPPNLPTWRDAPVVGPLSEALGAPAYLENDANAAALAEWRFGAGRGARRLVYLTMSTGVGGGLVLDGRLYRGRGDLAGAAKTYRALLEAGGNPELMRQAGRRALDLGEASDSMGDLLELAVRRTKREPDADEPREFLLDTLDRVAPSRVRTWLGGKGDSALVTTRTASLRKRSLWPNWCSLSSWLLLRM